MLTTLEKARYIYTIREEENDVQKRDYLWDIVWDELEKLYGRDYNKIGYVLDLFLIARLNKEYGGNHMATVGKNHLKRGLDKFHW